MGGQLVSYLLLVVAVGILSACTVREIRQQGNYFGSAGSIQGSVTLATGKKGPLIVNLYKQESTALHLTTTVQAGANGEYRLWADPGTYFILAYIDSNSDGAYQKGELWNYYGKPTGVPVAAHQTVTLDSFAISDQPPVIPDVKVESSLFKAKANIGKVIGLDDPAFSADNYSMGMWRPLDFLGQVGGGLFFLQDFEAGRTPIVFVHGINGGPTDFGDLVKHLDRKRYQPWILYYPSGIPLDMVSDYFASAVIALQNRHHFKKFAVVGHSMGGLVTRSFVKRFVELHPERASDLALVMTINSPLAGLPSAAYGAKSPFPVQSWRDLAPNSDFLSALNGWKWPDTIPYYLVFSYDKDDSDGVVPLLRQLPLQRQLEAARVCGFHNNHVDTLKDPSFLQVFESILAKGTD
jgi:pimeloyl-ACP methyl ester carboxylesterase